MKLYSGPLSLFTAKVRIALDEKGIDYEIVSVPFGRAQGYSPKHPDVVALNPKAQVPVLVDGPLSLYDSTIILEYLEETHPSPPLYPREPAAKARVRQLEAAADEILFPHVFELIQEVFYKPSGRDEGRIARARAAIAQHYAGLEARLCEQPFLAGDFGVADIGYFMTVTFATNLGAGLDETTPRLQAWYARVMARPSVTKEVTGLVAASQRVATG